MSNVLSVTGAVALLSASMLVVPGHADARPAVIYRAGRALCYYPFGWRGPGYYPCSRLHFAKPARLPRVVHYPVHVRVRAAHGGEIRWRRIRVGRGHDHGGHGGGDHGHHGHGGHEMAGGGHPHRMGGGYAGTPAHAERFGSPPMRGGSTHGGYTGGLGSPRETPVRGAPLGDGRIGRAPAAGMRMGAPIVGAPASGGMHVGAPMSGAPMGGGVHVDAPMGAAPMGGGMHMGAPMSAAPMGGGMHMGGAPAAAPAAPPAMHAPAAAPAPAAPPAAHH